MPDQKAELLASLLELVTKPQKLAEHIRMLHSETTKHQAATAEAQTLIAKAASAKEDLALLDREEARVKALRKKLDEDLKSHNNAVQANQQWCEELKAFEKRIKDQQDTLENEITTKAKMVNETLERYAEELDAREDDIRKRELIGTGRSVVNGAVA